MRFRPEQHLRRPGEFRAIREQGRRVQSTAFTLWYLPRTEVNSTVRLGVVASTNAVGGAILRNRARRRLREVFRLHQAEVPPGHDLLLVARHAINRLAYREIEQKFSEACRLIPTSAHA